MIRIWNRQNRETRRNPPLRAIASAAIVTGALSAAVAPSAASAAEKTAGFYYKVYIGGFHVVDLNIDMALQPKTYDIETRLKTIGMVGNLYAWGMQAYSSGSFGAAGKVLPEKAGQKNNWQGKERYIDMKFANGVPHVERIAPKPKADDRAPVPESLRKGALDLTSAIVAIVTRLDTGAPCQSAVPVFDGRRRFDLITKPDGTDMLKANRYSPFAGPTTRCTVSIDKKAGFKNTEREGWNDPGRQAKVWMGKPFEEVPPVPVRLTFDTPVGGLIAHLNHATYQEGRQKAELSYGNVRRAGFN